MFKITNKTFNEHKTSESEIYLKAKFEVEHNYYYIKTTKNEYEKLIKEEFKYQYFNVLGKRNFEPIPKGKISEKFYITTKKITQEIIDELEERAKNLYEFHKKTNHRYYETTIKEIKEKHKKNLNDENYIFKYYVYLYTKKVATNQYYDNKKYRINEIIKKLIAN